MFYYFMQSCKDTNHYQAMNLIPSQWLALNEALGS